MTVEESKAFKKAQWRFIVCSMVAYAFFYITRKNLSMAQPLMIEEGVITKVISTDLTYCPPEIQEEPWFVQADMSKYISYIIATLNHDRSLHGLLNPYNRIKALLDRYHDEQAAMGITMV